MDRLRETDENPFVAAITASVGTGCPTYRKEVPSLSAFALEDSVIYHTYSSYERGVDVISGMYPGSPPISPQVGTVTLSARSRRSFTRFRRNG